MKKIKTSSEIRGKEFTKAIWEFQKVTIKYFNLQIQDFLDYIDGNPQLFFEVIDFSKIQKFNKISNEDLDEVLNDFISIHVTWYITGQKFTDKSIKSDIIIWVNFDIDNTEAIEWAKVHAWEMIKYIDESTQEQISGIITKSIENWDSIETLKNKIYTKFWKYNETRSALIAQQEISIAFAQWKKRQFQKYSDYYNTVGYKRNIDQGDSAVRWTHADNTAEWWIAADQEFKATGTQEDPHDFNCRCVVEYRLTDPNQDPI